MKLSTWNWSTHPYNKTRGVAIGPLFGVMCYLSTPTPRGQYGLIVQFKRVHHRQV